MIPSDMKPYILSHYLVICLHDYLSWQSLSSQVANTRPKGQIQPSTLFYPTWHHVSTQRQLVKEQLHLYSPKITFGPLKATSRLMWPPGENEFDTPALAPQVSASLTAKKYLDNSLGPSKQSYSTNFLHSFFFFIVSYLILQADHPLFFLICGHKNGAPLLGAQKRRLLGTAQHPASMRAAHHSLTPHPPSPPPTVSTAE